MDTRHYSKDRVGACRIDSGEVDQLDQRAVSSRAEPPAYVVGKGDTQPRRWVRLLDSSSEIIQDLRITIDGTSRADRSVRLEVQDCWRAIEHQDGLEVLGDEVRRMLSRLEDRLGPSASGLRPVAKTVGDDR